MNNIHIVLYKNMYKNPLFIAFTHTYQQFMVNKTY